MNFLQKPLAWFSNFYLRVQSKICGRNNFFILPFWIFPDFERKVFQPFGQKTSRICQNYLLRVQRNNLWLEFFLKFESIPIFCRNHWHGSQNSIYVSRVKFAEEIIFLFFLSEFFRTLSEKFFNLLAKKRQGFVKTTFYVSRGTICGLNFFLKFESIPIFYRNLSHGSQNSIYLSRVKIALETVFLIFFSEFFRILSEDFSDFWPKNFKKFSKLSSTCPKEQFVAWNSSACFSKIYLRVQSKNFGRNSFLIFLFEFFRILSENISDFRRKIFKKLSKLPSACPEEQFVPWIFFLKFWIVLDFLQKPSAWFSKIYLRVQSKNCGRNSFPIFLFRIFFRILSEKFFKFRPKNFKKLSKLPSACPTDQFVVLKFLKKFWTVLDFLQKPFAWFSKFYLPVQSKNCVRNSFLNFLFRIFSDFERKNFQTFGQKTSKSCQNYLLRVQRNSLRLEFFF